MNDTEKVVVREWVKPGQKDEEKGRFTTSPASFARSRLRLHAFSRFFSSSFETVRILRITASKFCDAVCSSASLLDMKIDRWVLQNFL